MFHRYIGIDYSGAQVPTASLKGLRVYMADRDSEPVEVQPPPSPRKYWTRKGIAEWLVVQLFDRSGILVGIDHAFSFPLRYFEVHHLVPDWHPQCARLATPFAGGTGGTQQELCGALSGGMMVIGALLGREEAGVNDDEAQRLAARYRTCFLETFDATECGTLRRTTVKGSGGLGSCSVLVEQATALLLDVLAEAGYDLLND